MPFWLLLTLSVSIALLTLGGLVNFPYIPMLFGVYGGNRKTLKSRTLTKLILFFPAVALTSIILSWTNNFAFIFVPFAYGAMLWFFRLNKNHNAPPSNAAKNVDSLQAEADYEWQQLETSSAPAYVLFVCSCPSQENAKALSQDFKNMFPLKQAIELADENSAQIILEARIKLTSQTKNHLVKLTRDVYELTGQHSSAILSLSLMEL